MKKQQQRERWNRTSPELAAMLGVSEETIRNYVNAGAPKIARNQYDERAFIPWVIEQHKKRDTATFIEAQTRFTSAKARIAEAQAALVEGSQVRTADAEREYGFVVMAVKNRLLAMPSSLAPRLIACSSILEIQTLLDDEIWNALDELSRKGSNDSRSDGRGRKTKGTARAAKESRRTRTVTTKTPRNNHPQNRRKTHEQKTATKAQPA